MPLRPVGGRRDRVAAHLSMVLFSAMIALSFTLMAIVRDDIKPGPLNSIRFLLGTLVMGFAAFIWPNRNRAVPSSLWRFALLGLLSAIYFVSMFIALTISPPIAISAIFTFIPLIAAAIAFAVLRQRAQPSVILSLLFAGLGSVWVIFRGDLGAVLSFQIGRGEVIFFLGCVCYALYTVLLRRLNRGEPSATASFWTLAATTLWVAIYGRDDVLTADWTHYPDRVWFTIGYLSIFTTALTFFLLQFAVLRLPSAKVIAYGNLTPAFVIFFEGVAGHGWPSLSILAGALATVLGLGALAALPD